MAGGASTQDDERDSNNFRKVSASDFLKRTRAAELEMKTKHNQDQIAEKAAKAAAEPVKKPGGSMNKRLMNFE